MNSTLVVLLHEMAHAKIAYGRGYIMNQIVLMPYGAVLYGEEKMRKNDAVAIALAGPLFNLFIATAFFALWWLVPPLYAFTDSFVYSNISVALFNLLPIFPLDGSRAVIALSKNKKKTLRLLRALGIAVSLSMFGLFILSVFFEINFTLGVMAVFLFYGAVSGTTKERYAHIAEAASGKKDLLNGVEKKTVFVSQKVKLVRLLRMLSPNSLTTFVVTDEAMKPIRTLEEQEFGELLLTADGDKTVGEVESGKLKVEK
ncbi:MAG: hypothetical protein LBT20_03820 [Clostridiales bacterium]|nr:hypothetical protein [Clostridiales bacterium]